MIEIATNSAFEENHKSKHNRDAKNGWYRYDTRFAIPIYSDNDELERYNIYKKCEFSFSVCVKSINGIFNAGYFKFPVILDINGLIYDNKAAGALILSIFFFFIIY